MCDSECYFLVYEKDTGASWCRKDQEPDTCEMITKQEVLDQKAEDKFNQSQDEK
jgi:hypothetical protein